jgi:membrane associated rhomboid family serine protease
MLFPIGDDDRRLVRPTYVTWALLLANLAVFFFLQLPSPEEAFTYGYSVVPAEIVSGVDLTQAQQVRAGGEVIEIPQAPGPTPIWLTLLTSMFMHAGFAHLFGNLLYLWIFGDNVEHRFGALPFLAFYLVSGLAGTALQIALDPGSVIPSLGASGAISGVLGAYLVLFPRNRVHTLVFFFFVVSLPAVIVIGAWVAFQFFNGFGSFVATEQTVGGVAYGAHIGGFLAGVAMALWHRARVKVERAPLPFERAYQRDNSRRLW